MIGSRFFGKFLCGLTILLVLPLASLINAQTDDSFGDIAADPVKLFERGQTAYSRGDFKSALDFYEQAIELRPEFPEAAYQLGSTLLEINRPAEAEAAYRRAIALRKDWSLPYVSLANLLVRGGREHEAEPLLVHSLELDGKNSDALVTLAAIRLNEGKAGDAVELSRRATEDPTAVSSVWTLRAVAEHKSGDNASALTSLTHALQLEPRNPLALQERSRLRVEARDYGGAIEDLKAALRLEPGNISIAVGLADAYDSAGNPEEARKVRISAGLSENAQTGGNGPNSVRGSSSDIDAANNDDPKIAGPALERLLQTNQRNSVLLARIGALYRTTHPDRSLEYYHRAVEIEPHNSDFAAGYAAALVQARRFAEAAAILQRVIAISPGNYSAHANLATSFYEMKRFPDAIVEYQWLLKSKPDLTVAYYFIATAHDFLGEYREALKSYEAFLSKADSGTNQLEIDKAKLRIPAVRNEINHGPGSKRHRKSYTGFFLERG